MDVVWKLQAEDDQQKVEYVNSLLSQPGFLTEVGLAFWYHAVYSWEKEDVI